MTQARLNPKVHCAQASLWVSGFQKASTDPEHPLPPTTPASCHSGHGQSDSFQMAYLHVSLFFPRAAIVGDYKPRGLRRPTGMSPCSRSEKVGLG